MATVLTDPKILAAKFNDTFNTHNESAIKALVSPQIRFTAPGDVRLSGSDAFIGYLSGWLKAVPDARMTIRHEIVSAPWVVQEYTFEGTHKAAAPACAVTKIHLMPSPPSGVPDALIIAKTSPRGRPESDRPLL